MTFDNQTCGAAVYVNARMARDVVLDGIMGLGFGDLNSIMPEPQKTWFENVKGGLAEPIFAVALKYRAPGGYDFGFVDETKYEGEITWVDSGTENTFWDFYATAFSVGDGEDMKDEAYMFADTGTSFSGLPTTTVDEYYAQIPGSNCTNEYWACLVRCDAKMPDLTMTVGGAKFTISGKHLIHGPLEEEGSDLCLGGIQPFGSVLGENLLKSLYLIHEDRSAEGQGPRLGFAQQAAA